MFLEELLRPAQLVSASDTFCPYLSDLQVLQVASTEWNVRYDFNLSIANLRDGDRVPEISNTVFDLDLVVEKLLECGQIENLVADWLGTIDGVLHVH